MSAHTPGPWTLDSFHIGAFEVVAEGKAHSGGDLVICSRGQNERRELEFLANARLIAAAPDLLDALQYAMPYLRAAVPNPRNGINADCTVDVNCVDRALAAIAKATGSSTS